MSTAPPDEPYDRMRADAGPTRPSALWGLVAVAVVGVIGGVAVLGREDAPTPEAMPSTTVAPTTTEPVEPWSLVEPTEVMTLEPYAGLGSWVDVFDFDPAYQDQGRAPVVSADDLAVMAASGVETVYLQAARLDAERTPDGLAAPDLVADWLDIATELGMDVVAWYLPTFEDVEADLERLDLLRRFETGRGNRFAGIGVDIEFRRVEDVAVRTANLVEMSRRLDEIGVDGDVWGGIVLPPTLLEVVNPDFWPGFPWAELAPHYDVWLPMSYWSDRTEASGFKDGLDYNVDAVTRLRANLGDPNAIVHSIGGIGDRITERQISDFVESLGVTRSIGGSIYDYRTMSSGGWSVLRDGIEDAAAEPPSTTIPDDREPDDEDTS